MLRSLLLRGVFVIVFVVSAVVLRPSTAQAQRGGYRGGGVAFVGGYFYNPMFGPYPWWRPSAYPYPYVPVYDDRAEVRLLVTPKEAAVYVDGFYAGIVDDFNGLFQSLPLPPGTHELTIYLDSYRTVHQSLSLSPGKSYKVRYTMERLSAGEQSEAPPIAAPVPPPPPGSAMLPPTLRGGPGPILAAPLPRNPASPPPNYAPPPQSDTPPPPSARAQRYGTLVIQVQPADAEILIDGERWTASQAGARLPVQLSGGRHHVEIQRSGYQRFVSDLTVAAGDTTPLNVSLSVVAQ